MAHAERTGDTGVVAKLREYGPPPYADIYANAYVMQHYEALEPDYSLIPAVEQIGEDHLGEIGPMGVFGREYNLVEKVNVMHGLMETFAVLYPQLQRSTSGATSLASTYRSTCSAARASSRPGMTSPSSGSTPSPRPASTATDSTTPATPC